MKIKSIRYGFANNSSSSHSIVFLGNHKANDDAQGGDFGWDYFTAVNEQSKKEYLFATLLQAGKVSSYIPKTTLTEKSGWLNPANRYEAQEKYGFENQGELQKSERQSYIDYALNIENSIKWEVIQKEFTDVFGKELVDDWMDKDLNKKLGSWDSGIPYIDHQSVLSLPIYADGRLHIEFLKKFFHILITKNFAILGGNDNNGDPHKLEEKNTVSDDPTVQAVQKVLNLIGTENVGPVCVYDEINDDFIIQNDRNGNKVRISFNIDSETKKSAFPELVDLKITDNCNYGCKFCYQSSTKEGKHANIENVKSIVKTLSNSRVMEIAIGGGEPTMHPNLLGILKDIRSRNVIACFTTKNFELHTRPDFEEIIKTANSIAFSCNSVAEIEKVKDIKDAISDFGFPGYEGIAAIYIQMIPELMTDSAFDKALKYIETNFHRDACVTLLGYKDFGFGINYKPKNRFQNSDWIDTLKNHSGKYGINFGIDSVLVSKWKNELIEKGVNPLALVGEEGKFSCYVDAVTMTIHKSSFSKEAGIPLTGQEETVKEQFATF